MYENFHVILFINRFSHIKIYFAAARGSSLNINTTGEQSVHDNQKSEMSDPFIAALQCQNDKRVLRLRLNYYSGMRFICNREWWWWLPDKKRREARRYRCARNFETRSFWPGLRAAPGGGGFFGGCFRRILWWFSSVEMRCARRCALKRARLFCLLTANYGAERHVSRLGRYFRSTFTRSGRLLFAAESFHL